MKLIDCSEVQRLRRIKQLGFSEMTFPGATHTRLAHSIGVLNMTRLFLEQIERQSGKLLREESRLVVLCAALLHDVGHGPFSHAFEKITEEHHEERTREIITSSDTQIRHVLEEVDRELPEKVREFQKEDFKGTPDLPAYYRKIYSSQLDADRFDYLLRDSYSTGVDYGTFDYRWLISHLYIDEKKGRLFLSKKALLAAEAYVFARHHMYQIVYFHKTTRAAEVMFRLLLKRYKEIVRYEQDKAD